MKKKAFQEGNESGRQRQESLRREVNALLSDPKRLVDGIPALDVEKSLEKFEKHRVLQTTSVDSVSSLKSVMSRRVFGLALKAAVVVVVFSFGYLMGILQDHRTAEDMNPVGSYGTVQTEIVTVRLVLHAPEAQRVEVAGDWNGWNPSIQPMRDKDGDGTWEVHIYLQQGMEYQYQFVIDGSDWLADPNARVQIDDGFGGTNSLLRV